MRMVAKIQFAGTDRIANREYRSEWQVNKIPTQCLLVPGDLLGSQYSYPVGSERLAVEHITCRSAAAISRPLDLFVGVFLVPYRLFDPKLSLYKIGRKITHQPYVLR